MKSQDSGAGMVNTFINKPVATMTLLAVIVTLGLIAYVRIPIQLLPDGFGNQTFTIFIANENSNPRETEDRVSRIVEEQVRTIPGVRRVRSQSGADRASIRVEFAGNSDMDVAYAELRDRMEKIRPQLPRGSDRYQIFRFSLDESTPILFGGLLFDLDPYDPKVNDLCENVLKRHIEGVPGVARVNVGGMLVESIRILLDVDRVRAQRVDLVKLVGQLSRDNFASPVGKMEDGGAKYLLRVDTRFRDVEEIADIPIGGGLRIRDVGEVKKVQAIRESLTRVSDMRDFRMKAALVCDISKVSGANTVETSQRVIEAMEELEKRPEMEGFRFDVWFDQGKMIGKSISDLEGASKDGAWFAIIVLLFFLRRVRLTLLISLAIPVSLLATLVSIYFTGGSFNIVSMAGITLAIGSLVDNAIVVVENIHRKREAGVGFRESVVDGTKEVGVAIMLATFTSVIVFVPLIFMGERRSLRVTMAALGSSFSVSLLASLVVALVFIPVAIFHMERASATRLETWIAKIRGIVLFPLAAPGKLIQTIRASSGTPPVVGPAVGASRRGLAGQLGYEWIGVLKFSLNHRFISVLIGLIFILSIPYAAGKVEISSGGGGDGGGFRIRVDLPQNTTLRNASEEFSFYENLLLQNYDKIKFFDLSSDFSRTGGALTLWFERGFTKTERENLRTLVRDLLPPRATSVARLEESGSAGESAGVRFVLIGRDSDQLAVIGENVKNTLQSIPELTNVRSELERGRPEVRVRIDREQAQRMALDPTSISGAIEWGLRGYLISRMQDADIERQVIIQYKGAEDSNLASLLDTKLFSRTGGELPLSTVASIDVGKGYGEIFRRDGKTALSVSADILAGDAKVISKKANDTLAPLIAALPREVALEQEGAIREFERDQSEMGKALLMGLILVYVILAITFESMIIPLSILMTAPLAFFGAYWALYLTGTAFDALGLLSLVVLVGVAVNHGVVLVDHIIFLRKTTPMTRSEAVVQGSIDRLRPVLMTALTTIVGLIPMATATETGGQGLSYKVLAISVCGGLSTSTFFTLWFVPVCYTLFDDLGAAVVDRFRAGVRPWIPRVTA